MIKKNQDILVERYLKLLPAAMFEKDGMMKTCMYWGFDVGDGWFNIVDKMCNSLLKLNNIQREKDLDNHCLLSQVKEKFGTLRVYVDIYTHGSGDEYTQDVYNIIRIAENESCKTCEVCGEPGEINRGGWLSVRCDACRKAKE